MSLDRRTVIASGVAASAAAFLGPRARAAEPRVLRIGFASKTVNGQGLNTLLGEPLGYARAAGLRIDGRHLGSISNVLAALDRGAVDIGVCAPSFSLPLYAKGELPPVVAFYEYTYPYKWDIVVKPDSPIAGYGDLRGKKLGIANLGMTDYPVTRTVLRLNGIDPDKDVSWQVVGEGVTAGIALQRGVIDALAYFDVGFGMIENAGIALRYLPRPAQVPMIGGLFMGAKRDFLAANRAACVSYGRVMAMATEFVLANPVAAARVYLERWPEAAPRGVSAEDAIAQTVRSVQRRIALYKPPYAGGRIGEIFPSEWREEAKFLGLDIPDLTPLFTTTLTDEVNDFDHARVIAAAKA